VKYPLLAPLLAAVTGILLCHEFVLDADPLYWLCLTLSFFSLILIRMRQRTLSWLMILLAFITLYSGRVSQENHAHLTGEINELLIRGDGQTDILRFSATILSPPTPKDEYCAYEILINSIVTPTTVLTPGQRAVLTVQLKPRWKLQDLPFQIGDQVMFPGKIKNHRYFKNPGNKDKDYWRKLYGSQGTISLKSPLLIEHVGTESSFLAPFTDIRQQIITRISANFASDSKVTDIGALLISLAVGEKAYLSSEKIREFQSSGLMHILSLSGFHVAVALTIILLILRFLRIKSPYSDIILIISILYYWLISGMSVATTRAVILAITWIAGRLIQREGNSINILVFAALILLFISPNQLFSPGFQLSFGAAFGLMVLPNKLIEIYPLLKLVPRFLISIICAQAMTFPLVVLHFKIIVGQALLINFLILPIISLPIAIVILYSLILHWIPIVNDLALQAASLILKCTEFIMDLMADLFPWSTRTPTSDTEYIYITLVLFLAAIWLIFRFPRLKIFGVFAIALVVFLPTYNTSFKRPETVELHVLDVGMGDSNLMLFPDGKIIVIDTGGSPIDDFDYGEFVVSEYILAKNIRKIDVLVVTHMDADHAEGTTALIRNFEIGEIWLPDVFQNNDLAIKILKAINDKKIPVRYLCRGMAKRTPHFSVRVYNPANNSLSIANSANNNSLVLQFTFKNWQCFFTADTEKEMLDEISPIISATEKPVVLKLPHHGSSDAFSPQFLDQVNACLAIVSASHRNVYRFPRKVFEEYFSKRDVPLLQTGLQGMLKVFYRNGKLLVEMGEEGTRSAIEIIFSNHEYSDGQERKNTQNQENVR
jgi:competence protein ComEC